VSFSNTTKITAENPVIQTGTVTAVTVPYPVGSKISVTGFSPVGYNGVFTVTAASLGSISFANTTTGAVTTYGSVTLTVYYQLIAGSLPSGMQIDETGIITGIPSTQVTLQGVPSDVPADTSSKFAVRAYTRTGTVINRLADRTFTLEVANTTKPAFVTPPGQIAELYDASLITDIQIEYTGPNATIVRFVSGNLPPDLTVGPTGKISGLIGVIDTSTNYEFTLELSDGTIGGNALRTFSIYVWSRSNLSADDTYITADNTFITADGTPVLVPVLLNPEGSIGTVRSDNFFAYKFNGFNFVLGSQLQYLINTSLPGLTLDPNSGWLYGNIPPLGINNQTYSFNVRLKMILESAISGVEITGVDGQFSCTGTVLYVGQQVSVSGTLTGTGDISGYVDPTTYYIIATNGTTEFTLGVGAGGLAVSTTAGTTNGLVFTLITDVLSQPYSYSLTVIGPVSSDITWLTPSYLGSINNGDTSTFYVEAVNRNDVALQYQLLSGSDSRLPQGLQLLPTGEIAGQVSFNTFALDMGTTTFDNNTTTFDMVCYFTVNAYSTNGLINSNQVFSIKVVRRYNEPYNNLYIQAMPPFDDRVLINSLLQNTDIFKQELIYRPTDPNFGVSKNVTYYHAYGLTAATYEDYVSSLDINHYWKNLVLGSIEVAQACNSNGTVIYEVVYSRIIDDLVNAQGESVSKDVILPYPVTTGPYADTNIVYPNSLINMRDQVIDTVGQISNTLPLWMLCKQANGQTLGFTPAWVIAYAKPGRGEQLAYYIGQDFIGQLNTIDFEVDRYELDNFLTKNWDRAEQYWGPPHPPSMTTFDLIGLPPFSLTESYQVGDVVQYQTIVGGVRINKVYVCLQNTTPGTLPTNTTYWSSNGQEIASWINDADVITTWEDENFTLATWTYATPPGTTFDGGSMQFTAPVDMYSATNTNVYDKYLLFPRRNILQPLPQVNSLVWVNNYNESFAWVNDFGQAFIWIVRK